MKPYKLILIALVNLFLSTEADCKKKKDCHKEIIINNNSNSPIICASKWHYGNTDKCNLSGPNLITGDSHKLVFGQFSCWENTLSGGKTQDVYLLDPNHYNNPNVYYACDSVEIKNTVLKHYVLTLADLKKNNFTITYL